MSPSNTASDVEQCLSQEAGGKAQPPREARKPVLFHSNATKKGRSIRAFQGSKERVRHEAINVRCRAIELDADHKAPWAASGFTPPKLVIATDLAAKDRPTGVNPIRCCEVKKSDALKRFDVSFVDILSSPAPAPMGADEAARPAELGSRRSHRWRSFIDRRTQIRGIGRTGSKQRDAGDLASKSFFVGAPQR